MNKLIQSEEGNREILVELEEMGLRDNLKEIYTVNKDLSSPLEYYFDYTNACNLKCNHCYNKEYLNCDTMTDEQIENVIDFESLEFVPQDFQFASMLASGLLLEGENMKKIKQTIQKRGKDVNKILYLMQIRTLEGLFFFAKKMNEYVSTNQQVSGELLKKYFFLVKSYKEKWNLLKHKRGGQEIWEDFL